MIHYDNSLTSIVANADIVVKAVILILLIFSIHSWTIIINKYTKFRIIKKSHQKIIHLVSKHTPIDQVYQQIGTKAVTPLEKIYVLLSSESQKNNNSSVLISKATSLKNKMIMDLESQLGLLATVSSSSPFIGLFGTVWGIMHSFQSIAVSQKTSLVIVAPGIAEALFATAIGLFAAIPALIFCNLFNDKITQIDSECDNLINDLLLQFSTKE